MAKDLGPESQQGMQAIAQMMVDAGAEFCLAVKERAYLVVGDGVPLLWIVEALRLIADGIEQESPQLIGHVTVEVEDDSDA